MTMCFQDLWHHKHSLKVCTVWLMRCIKTSPKPQSSHVYSVSRAALKSWLTFWCWMSITFNFFLECQVKRCSAARLAGSTCASKGEFCFKKVCYKKVTSNWCHLTPISFVLTHRSNLMRCKDIFATDNGHRSINRLTARGSLLLLEHSVLMSARVFKASLWSHASYVTSA